MKDRKMVLFLLILLNRWGSIIIVVTMDEKSISKI